MEESAEHYKPLIQTLRAFADSENFSNQEIEELKVLLRNASDVIEDLSDFTISLVDQDGNQVFQISDEQVREVVSGVLDKFVQSSITLSGIPGANLDGAGFSELNNISLGDA